jgi:hypothetical protein
MDSVQIKNYLSTLCDKNEIFNKRCLNLIDLFKIDLKMDYISSERYETSLVLKRKKNNARFIHYFMFRDNLTSLERKYAGYISARKFLEILKNTKYSDSKNIKIIHNLISFIGNSFEFYPRTIISFEWDVSKMIYLKSTFYIVFNRMNFKNIEKLANLIDFRDVKELFQLFKNIDMFAVDVFYNKKALNYKIYNRYPLRSYGIDYFYNYEKKGINMIGLKKVNSVIRLNRIYGHQKISEHEKSYIMFKKPVDLLYIDKLLNDQYRGLLIDKKITNFSVTKEGDILEIYFE